MMLALFTAIKSKFMGYLAVAAVVVGVLWASIRYGRKLEKADRAADTLDAVKDYKEIEHEVDALSPDARRDALRKWMRDDK